MPDKPIFLLVEDTESDALLIQRAFQKANVLNPLFRLNNAEQAITYLLGVGACGDRAEFPLPALILLDLKLPGLDGFDFLRWLRRQPTLCSIRVVILSSSDDMRDISLAYKLGANSFLIKPVDFERFVEISQALNGYWIWMDKGPDASHPPQPLQSDSRAVADQPALEVLPNTSAPVLATRSQRI